MLELLPQSHVDQDDEKLSLHKNAKEYKNLKTIPKTFLELSDNFFEISEDESHSDSDGEKYQNINATLLTNSKKSQIDNINPQKPIDYGSLDHLKNTQIKDSNPDHYSDGIPIFKPTFDQFKDFYGYIKSIDRFGMQSGIVKIIPPKEWLDLIDNLNLYDEERLTAKIKIKNPIVQHISKLNHGCFNQINIQKSKSYTIYDWKREYQKNYLPPISRSQRNSNTKKVTKKVTKNKNKNENAIQNLSNYNIDTSEFDDEKLDFLENNYWKSLSYGGNPMYGADCPGSLFPSPDKFNTWNISNLPNFLNYLDSTLSGINDPYLYAGLWKSTFSWHLEDQDLYSINYIHFGAPKQWYSIPQDHQESFYNLMKELYPIEYKSCKEFLRHKTFLVSPTLLRKKNIPVNKVRHYEKEFIITYPYGYHSGFNYGYNLAESVNFATDTWFDIGLKSHKCECISDAAFINVKNLMQNVGLLNHPDNSFNNFSHFPVFHPSNDSFDNEDDNDSDQIHQSIELTDSENESSLNTPIPKKGIEKINSNKILIRVPMPNKKITPKNIIKKNNLPKQFKPDFTPIDDPERIRRTISSSSSDSSPSLETTWVQELLTTKMVTDDAIGLSREKRKTNSQKIWHYVEDFSNEKVARFSDDANSQQPNDPSYRKYLGKLKRRKVKAEKTGSPIPI
ncbi:JmjC-domain-containing protein [Ascoidea rubescens DSM 1968]|uniref:JmjC-domain-containing protein n=1 Tax=Ascoidea rubescens DSM 1968 TaxID=1344418 RepID=A0A1D2VLJ9_9ASCO|nr:JmjC-domain-containing protein [Ascoidea rubescens DSM 1968]ODV62417.1 JmjC-domain-containing protein [Ascoidea rubescens DSM 1968]